jgi:hypothetical protein
MKKKAILKDLDTVWEAFDGLEKPCGNGQERDYGELRSFGLGILGENKRLKTILGKDYSKKADDFTPLHIELFEAGFGFGVAIGNLFDAPYPKVQKALKSIQALLKEKALLPYFPRER